MTSASHASPRKVPGRYGLPVLGSVFGTIEFFLVGWERYFVRRRDSHGSSVFKVNLFRPTIAVLDQKGIEPLFADPTLIQDYGFSWAVPPKPLVGGHTPSIFEHGPAHDTRKALYLAMVAERGPALAGVFATVADEFFGRWEKQGEFVWGEQIEEFAISLVFEWMLGARPDVDDVRLIYNNIFLHLTPWLAKLDPNSTYNRSLKAYPRFVDFIRSAPLYPRIVELAKAHGVDEVSLPHQLAFLLGMNSFLGMQCTLKSVVGELSRQGPLQDDLASALKDKKPHEALADPLLDGVLREVLRMHPPVFFVFGRATQARTLESGSGTFAIKKGELVMGVIPFAQEDPALFPDPLTFDPLRYSEASARDGLMWPRGRPDQPVAASDKVCPGKDPAVLLAKMFCARLALGYRWRLKAAPEWTRKKYSLNVAAPVGDLAVSGFSALP